MDGVETFMTSRSGCGQMTPEFPTQSARGTSGPSLEAVNTAYMKPGHGRARCWINQPNVYSRQQKRFRKKSESLKLHQEQTLIKEEAEARLTKIEQRGPNAAHETENEQITDP